MPLRCVDKVFSSFLSLFFSVQKKEEARVFITSPSTMRRTFANDKKSIFNFRVLSISGMRSESSFRLGESQAIFPRERVWPLQWQITGKGEKFPNCTRRDQYYFGIVILVNSSGECVVVWICKFLLWLFPLLRTCGFALPTSTTLQFLSLVWKTMARLKRDVFVKILKDKNRESNCLARTQGPS